MSVDNHETHVKRSQAAGAATRELHKLRRAMLEADPIDWDERIARLREILEATK